MIDILVNGERTRVACRSLDDLLEQLGHDGDSVATAVNGCFVACAQRKGTELADGMDIEIVAPMQGG